MKRVIVFLFTLTVFFTTYSLVFGCTSFVVYEGKPIYGMNFDNPRDVKIKFCITRNGNLKVFRLLLYLEQHDLWLDITGMNSKGLFSAVHEQLPYQKKVHNSETDTLVFWAFLANVLEQFENTKQVLEYLAAKRLIQVKEVSVHNLTADKYGNTILAETAYEKNILTKMYGKFQVMANFPLHEFANKPYNEVEGVGADRYKIVHAYLQEHVQSFDINHGLKALQAAKNKYEEAPTRCSMVFDPTDKVIYIALEANFNKIWKVSLDDETIETYRGFKTSLKLSLNEKGILVSELYSHQ